MRLMKQFSGAFAVIAIAAMPAFAQDVAEGQWLNIFDGESLFGWTQFGDVKWEVKDAAIHADAGSGGWLSNNAQFQDFELDAKVSLDNGSAGLVVRGALEGSPDENGSGVITLSAGDNQEIHVVAKGDSITATLNGKPIEGLKATNPRGHIGIQYHHRHGEKEPYRLTVHSLKLRPLALKSIFNGKDLTGWNQIPGHKSEFSVKEGAINIVHGNGQIETAGTFQNFTLQIDVYSNGDHLNSGIFYRTPPGVFWKGYECQVRNQWEGDDRTKAVDFGTGGNYGNQPARKVVSSDREWFNVTVVVDGNHDSNYVNGYLVADYYDERPLSAEADGKSGFVSPAGTINLQGHDPTTDLSFKNINIQEYK